MKKLMLKDLEVKSFVTVMKAETSETVKGGTLLTFEPGCDTSPVLCNFNTLPQQCQIVTLDIGC